MNANHWISHFAENVSTTSLAISVDINKLKAQKFPGGVLLFKCTHFLVVCISVGCAQQR